MISECIPLVVLRSKSQWVVCRGGVMVVVVVLVEGLHLFLAVCRINDVHYCYSFIELTLVVVDSSFFVVSVSYFLRYSLDWVIYTNLHQ